MRAAAWFYPVLRLPSIAEPDVQLEPEIHDTLLAISTNPNLASAEVNVLHSDSEKLPYSATSRV
jgi:hypothetical protein